MATLRLEIVTPEAKTYSDDVDGVVIPGVEGELGILPQHVALMTQLLPGELRITKNGQETRLAVGEGFVEITGDKVSVTLDLRGQTDNQTEPMVTIRLNPVKQDEAPVRPSVGRIPEVGRRYFNLGESMAPRRRRRHRTRGHTALGAAGGAVRSSRDRPGGARRAADAAAARREASDSG